MFAHVSPEADSFGETISTLKFAQRASTVELGAARMNKESTEVKALKEQVNEFSAEITTILHAVGILIPHQYLDQKLVQN